MFKEMARLPSFVHLNLFFQLCALHLQILQMVVIFTTKRLLLTHLLEESAILWVRSEFYLLNFNLQEILLKLICISA